MAGEVLRIDLTIDETDVIRGAGEVLKVIRPHWRSDSVRFKVRIWRGGKDRGRRECDVLNGVVGASLLSEIGHHEVDKHYA